MTTKRPEPTRQPIRSINMHKLCTKCGKPFIETTKNPVPMVDWCQTCVEVYVNDYRFRMADCIPSTPPNSIDVTTTTMTITKTQPTTDANNSTPSASASVCYDLQCKSSSAPLPEPIAITCIECGSYNMQREGRCRTCMDCGWSKCNR